MKEECNLAAERASRVVAVIDQYLAERRAGRATSRDELLRRHPDLAKELAECMAGLELIHEELGDAAGNSVPGGMLGDFLLHSEIGRGGMGVVYDAEQVSLGRRVALKVLPFAAVMDPRQLQRFKNEAQAAAHLHHTNIVPVHSIGCERGVHYYAMQFIEGPTVAQVIEELRAFAGRDVPPSPSSAVHAITKGKSTRSEAYCRGVARLGVQAAEALDHAHAQGVVHRDIKPANLIVDAGGHLWITDFGLASFASQPGLTVTGDLVGTVRYMSPEQARTKRVPVDHRTDIYSLGVTLYELLTLEVAFAGDDPHKVIQDIAFREPRSARGLNPAVPAELETILVKAMAKDPAERYATAQDLAEDLERFLDHKPIHARRPALLQRTVKWSRRHPAVVRAAVVVLLLTAAVLGASVAMLLDKQKEVDAQAERAEANFSKALAAVDEMLMTVAVRDIAEIPHMEQARRELLLKAHAFLQGFLEERGPDPRIREEVARAYRRIGELDGLLGEHAEGVEHYRKAIEVAGRLAEESPREPAWLQRVIRWQGELGALLEEAGRGEEADRALVAMVREAEELVRSFPNTPEHEHLLAKAHLRRGIFLREFNRHDEAKEALAVATDLLKRLGDAYAAELGVAYFQTAQTHHVNDENEEAFSCYSHALEIQTGLHAAQPRDLDRIAELGETLYWRGQLLLRAGQAGEAERSFRGALERFDTLVREAPHNATWRNSLAASHSGLGWALARLGRMEESEEERRSAIRIIERLASDYPRASRYRRNLAVSYEHLGSTLKKTGRLAEAERYRRLDLDLREQLASEYPDKPVSVHDLASSYHNLANLLDQTNRPAEGLPYHEHAVRTARDLVGSFPDVVRYWLLLANNLGGLGLGLAHLGRFDDARNAVREAIEIAGRFADERPGLAADAHIWLANVHELSGDFDAAENAYRDAILLRPSNAVAHYQLGLLLLDKRGDARGAALAFRRAADLDPEAAPYQFALGRALETASELRDAVEVYREAAARERTNADYQVRFAIALRRCGQLEEAIRTLRASPETSDTRFQLAETLVEQDDLEEAVASYRRTIELAPDLLPAYGRLAATLEAMGDHTAAIETLRAGLRVTPDPRLQVQLAWLYANCPDERFRDPARAVELARAAVGLEPGNAMYLATLGAAYYRAGQWRESMDALEESGQRAGGFGLFLAMARWRLGDLSGARAGYEEAIQDKNVNSEAAPRHLRCEAARLLGFDK